MYYVRTWYYRTDVLACAHEFNYQQPLCFIFRECHKTRSVYSFPRALPREKGWFSIKKQNEKKFVIIITIMISHRRGPMMRGRFSDYTTPRASSCEPPPRGVHGPTVNPKINSSTEVWKRKKKSKRRSLAKTLLKSNNVYFTKNKQYPRAAAAWRVAAGN